MNKETKDNLIQVVKKNYEEVADDFHETRKKPLWPELVKLAQGVKAGDRVLDVGCGSGRLVTALEGKQVEYLGIDTCSRLVDIANETHPDFNFIIGDVLNLERVKELEFNFIFAIAILQHIPGKELRVKALEQMKEKVREDGKIIITVWNMWARPKFRKLIFKYSFLKLFGQNKMDWGDIMFKGFNKESERYYHAFRRGELRRLAKAADLKVEKLYQDQYNYYAVLKK